MRDSPDAPQFIKVTHEMFDSPRLVTAKLGYDGPSVIYVSVLQDFTPRQIDNWVRELWAVVLSDRLASPSIFVSERPDFTPDFVNALRNTGAYVTAFSFEDLLTMSRQSPTSGQLSTERTQWANDPPPPLSTSLQGQHLDDGAINELLDQATGG